MKYLSVILCGLLVVATAIADEPRLSRFSFNEPHMGTKFEIIVYAPDETTASKAARAGFDRIAALDGIMSDYKQTSELMRLCKKSGGEPVKVSDDLFTILERSQELAKASDGAFDVTIGPVVKLWRRARKSIQLPDPEDLAAARKLVGFDKVKLDRKDRTVQLTTPGMQLDLGGIAKGYAADAAQKVLKEHGIKQALVAAGGDVVVSDPPPGAEGWKVAVASLAGADKAEQFLMLKNAAVSTSGDAEQYVEIEGKRYSHIVDPRTGLGLLGRQSVTVIAPDGTTSDSLATAVCVMGPEKGIKFVDDMKDVSCLFLRKTDKGQETIASKRFPKK